MSRQTTAAQFHKPKTLDNKYMLGDEIGKGAYGRVYKGLDLENGDFVAIKQVSLENIAQEDLNIIMVRNCKILSHTYCANSEKGSLIIEEIFISKSSGVDWSSLDTETEICLMFVF
ncbi:Tyrosine-protein kinase [Parasponia andersonii]|uniref:non-specific serine/threonine protein kinase n=1 Tax=Parasponia andersonii TaxID=3476 RepID=A0A2P5AYT1_PARAD|nr:Tyrosine-protein kinase [Parasponia andersonii]